MLKVNNENVKRCQNSDFNAKVQFRNPDGAY